MLIVLIVVSGVIIYKLPRVDTSDLLVGMKDVLISYGVTNHQQLKLLKQEIIAQDEKDDKLVEEIISIVKSIFKSVLVVPLGFLFGILFSNDSTVNYENVTKLAGLLFGFCAILISGVVFIYPLIKFLVSDPRRNRGKIYRYIVSVEYLFLSDSHERK